MIALKLTDEYDSVLEVSQQTSYVDDSKECIYLELTTTNNEFDKEVTLVYYIDSKEQANALITKLVSLKKSLG